MDAPIAVRSYPYRQAFDSVDAAVTHAFSHPARTDAKRDAERLAGATLVDGYWTSNEWNLQFSNGLSLRIWAPKTEVRWQVGEQFTEPLDEPVRRVGSPPIRLRFSEPHGTREMDGSALFAKRCGATFYNLEVNHTGLYLYFRTFKVLEFHAAFRVDGTGNVLYGYEDD